MRMLRTALVAFALLAQLRGCEQDALADGARMRRSRAPALLGTPAGDTTPPTDGTVTLSALHSRISVSWSGYGGDTANYRAVVLTGATNPAAQCANGTEIYSGTGTSFTYGSDAAPLTNGIVHRIRVCASDDVGNVSAGDVKSTTPANQFATHFDGAAYYVTVPDSATIDANTAHLTVCGWFRAGTNQINENWITKWGQTGSGSFSWRFGISTSALRMRFGITTTACNNATAATKSTTVDSLTNGAYSMACAVYDGTQGTSANRVILYSCSGGTCSAPTQTEAGTIPATYFDCTAPLEFGRAQQTGGFYGDGFIDETILWNTSLTSGNITTVYNGGVPIHPALTVPAGLVSFWTMGDHDSGATLTDHSNVNSNNGTLTAGAEVVSTPLP